MNRPLEENMGNMACAATEETFAVLLEEESTSRSLLVTTSIAVLQRMASLAARDWQHSSQRACFCRVEERQRASLQLDATRCLRVILFEISETVERIGEIVDEEQNERIAISFAKSYEVGLVTERVAFRVDEDWQRQQICFQVVSERRKLLAVWLVEQKIYLDVTTMSEEEEARRRFQRDFALESLLVERCRTEERRCREKISAMSDFERELFVSFSAWLQSVCRKSQSAVAELQGEEGSRRQRIELDQRDATAALLSSAIESEYITTVVPIVIDEMQSRNRLGRSVVDDHSRSTIAESEAMFRDALQRREMIVWSSLYNTMQDRVYTWRESMRLSQREVRARKTLFSLQEPLSRLEICALERVASCILTEGAARRSAERLHRAEVSLLKLVLVSELEMRSAIIKEEEDARRSQLTGASCWQRLRMLLLLRAEFTERDNLEDRWEAEVHRNELHLLQGVIAITDRLLLGLHQESDLHHQNQTAFGTSSPAGPTSYVLSADVFSSSSNRMFLAMTDEQEELPRRSISREEATGRLSIWTSFLAVVEASHRAQIRQQYDTDTVRLRWQNKSKKNVLHRTAQTYLAESTERLVLEESENRVLIEQFEEPLRWWGIDTFGPRRALLTQFRYGLQTLSWEDAVLRLPMKESFQRVVMANQQRIEHRRITEAHHLQMMVRKGAAGRRRVECEEALAYWQNLREPFERRMLQEKEVASVVGIVEWCARLLIHDGQEAPARITMIEEPMHRYSLMLAQYEDARGVLLKRLESIHRFQMVGILEIAARQQILFASKEDALWAQQKYLRRCAAYDERALGLLLEERCSRTAVWMEAMWTTQVAWVHMPHRMRVLLEEDHARQTLWCFFLLTIKEPYHRLEVVRDAREAMDAIEAGTEKNRSLFPLFAQERNARERLIHQECDEWETVGLRHVYRRASVSCLRSHVRQTAETDELAGKDEEWKGAEQDVARRLELFQDDYQTVKPENATDSLPSKSWSLPSYLLDIEDAELLKRIQLLRQQEEHWRAVQDILRAQEASITVSRNSWRRTPSKPMIGSPGSPRVGDMKHVGESHTRLDFLSPQQSTGTPHYRPVPPPSSFSSIPRSSAHRLGSGSTPSRQLNTSVMIPW